MYDIQLPEYHNALIALRPLFDDQEKLLSMDRDFIYEAYFELMFFKYIDFDINDEHEIP